MTTESSATDIALAPTSHSSYTDRGHRDLDGVPWRDYVHTLHLLDRAEFGIDDPPTHVASTVMLNGAVEVSANLHEPWSIGGGGDGATIVSLMLSPDDVQIGRRQAAGVHVPAMIGGLRVLTPERPRWETHHCYAPIKAPSGALQWEWVRVYIYVREARVLSTATYNAETTS